MTKPIKNIAFALTASMIVVGAAHAAHAGDYKFKFQSSDPAGNPNFVLQQDWARNLASMTNGQIQVEMMPDGAVVEHNETLDAAGAGIIDGIVTDISYFAGKDPAFSLLGKASGPEDEPPTSKQVGFAEQIAARKGIVVPDERLTSGALAAIGRPLCRYGQQKRPRPSAS